MHKLDDSITANAPATIKQEPFADMSGILSPQEFPRLTEVLAGETDTRLQLEIARLLQIRFRSRAARKAVKKTGRLRYEGYDEVVLIRDISASGVRMLIAPEPALDLARAASMRLLLKLDNSIHELPVAMVRVVNINPKGVDLACRFLNPEFENAAIAERLRSVFFAG